MSGFGAFLAKELTEIRRTWRIWVVPGIVIFMGLTSPVLAKLTPALSPRRARPCPARTQAAARLSAAYASAAAGEPGGAPEQTGQTD